MLIYKQSRLSERYDWSQLHVIWIIKDPGYAAANTTTSDENEDMLGVSQWVWSEHAPSRTTFKVLATALISAPDSPSFSAGTQLPLKGITCLAKNTTFCRTFLRYAWLTEFFCVQWTSFQQITVWLSEYTRTRPVKVRPLVQRKPTFLVSTGIFPVVIATIHEGIVWSAVLTTR